MTEPQSPVLTPVSKSAYGCITIPFLLLALLPLGWGARVNWMKGNLGRVGISVPGDVIELRNVPGNPSVGRRSRVSSSGGGESPVVAFTTRSGEKRTAVGSVNRYPPPWSVGQTVAVVYDSADPSRADLRTELDGWMLRFAIWCLVATVPLSIACLPIILAMRQRSKAPA